MFACSTPFGIIGIFTSSSQSRHTPRSVLNAFRHHWNLHPDNLTMLVQSWECSTPFGIIGIFTARSASISLTSPRCSTPFGIIGIFTSEMLRLLGVEDLCSTPFGIIGIFTETSRARPTRQLVLNAFRHHWNLHMNFEPLCAMVKGAQRLSASLESSPPVGGARRRHQVVLNAFRHHWNLHRGQAGRAHALSDVLNAFRHHWNLHKSLQGA